MPIAVVIVEDNGELREGLRQLIHTTPGFKCVGTFATCEQLLLGLERIRPQVALMDIGLPGMSGIEGVRALKERSPDVEVLMLTVYEDDKRIFDSICAGASGYLLKKTPPDGILEAIRDLREGGAPMSARVARRVLDLVQQQAPSGSPAIDLSAREREVLAAMVKGMSYKMIADLLSISVDTVRSHVKKIYEKLHVHSKSEAVVKALKHRII